MLEKPEIQDDALAAAVRHHYDVPVRQSTFLPLGADPNAAVYRVLAHDGRSYFLKLRQGPFAEIALTLPRFLSDAGVKAIIPPLSTSTGRLWADFAPFKLILYPFVTGHNGYERVMPDAFWPEFGRALRQIHDCPLPTALRRSLTSETYSGDWRRQVLGFLAQADRDTFTDPVAAQTATFLTEKRGLVCDLVERADRLAKTLLAQSLPFVLCHTDLHAGNILVNDSDFFYIVDWDEPIRRRGRMGIYEP